MKGDVGQGAAGHPGGQHRASRRSRPTRSGCGTTCGRLPKESPLFQRYLKTLEEQEKEMDDLQAKLKTLQADEAKSRAAYDEFLANLSAE